MLAMAVILFNKPFFLLQKKVQEKEINFKVY